MTYKFTNRAEKALEIANELAIELNHNYIGTEHLLYGLVNEGTGVASKVLEMQGVTSEKVLEEIEMLIGRGNEEQEKTETVGFTPRTKRVIEIRFGIYRNRTFIDRNNERGRQCSSKNNVRLKCKPSKIIQ